MPKCPPWEDRFALINTANFELTTGTAVLISAAVGAAGAVYSGAQAQKAANMQAAIDRQRAEREREVADLQAKEFERDQADLMAKRRALMGGSGVDPTSGSPLLVSEDFAAENEFQRLLIEAGGEDRATRLEQSARLQEMKGRNARTAGLVKGGSLLFQGAADSGLLDD